MQKTMKEAQVLKETRAVLNGKKQTQAGAKKKKSESQLTT
jgi:hypothetical protein